MTRIELDALRLRCSAALEAFEEHTARMIAHLKDGQSPPSSDLHAEEQALYEFAKLRRDVLDALSEVARRSH